MLVSKLYHLIPRLYKPYSAFLEEDPDDLRIKKAQDEYYDQHQKDALGSCALRFYFIIIVIILGGLAIWGILKIVSHGS